MDTTDKDIFFDSNGICNHCLRYDNLISKRTVTVKKQKYELEKLVKSIKRKGAGKKYDCIIGVSGGVDSSYVAYLTKKLGLRPLAIHFDNGWNSELAVSNIEKVLDRLDIDLFTYVIDWSTFKDLQTSFLLSSTPDGEIPTDHAINALLFKEASKRGIHYIINGMNFATESMAVESWAYGHSDWKYIKSIHKAFGSKSLKKYPRYNLIDLFYWTFIKKIRVISILNYINYDKEDAIKVIQDNLNWINYEGKHFESIYTRFYQEYILPEKFGINKKIGHLSDLVRSGQINRNDALEKVKINLYNDSILKLDKEFVLKKLNLNLTDFNDIMNLPKKSFRDYPNSYSKVKLLKNILNFLRDKNLYSK
jgi:N-acetyl sugar amidotransferase